MSIKKISLKDLLIDKSKIPVMEDKAVLKMPLSQCQSINMVSVFV